MTDFSVNQGLFQRIFRVGNIKISSSDNMQGEFIIRDIKKTYEIKEMYQTWLKKKDRKKAL